MASYLETIPRDILQHIVFLSGSWSIMDPPVDIFRFLQTSSVIYRSVNVDVLPDLYSHIYSTKFDTQAARRRYRERLPDSALAAELLSRSKLLRRSHRVDLSSDGLIQDLWTALWMVLENDSLNARQLYHANFCHFLLSLARVKLVNTRADRGTETDTRVAKDIILWLLCLSLPRRTFLDMPKEDRDELYALIFPYIFLDNLEETLAPLALSVSSHENQGYPVNITASGSNDSLKVYTYLKQQNLVVPDPSIAAINLAFVLFEINTIKIPHHLPETRAIALATLRSGPTQDDYKTMACYQTTLLADLPGSTGSRLASSPIPIEPDQSTNNDMGFGGILRTLCDGGYSETFSYIPGTVSGLWEGVFRTVETPIRNMSSTPIYQNSLFSVVMIKPMQCQLVEYICQSPDFESQSDDLLDRDLLDADICSPDLFNAVSVKHDSEIVFKGRKYNKHIPQTARTRLNRRSTIDAALHDVIVLGQTLEDHDQAWGGFKFLGRIRSDGRVLLKRESKYADGHQGLCIFAGQLRFNSLILGRWRIAGNSSNAHHGIFSLGKSRER